MTTKRSSVQSRQMLLMTTFKVFKNIFSDSITHSHCSIYNMGVGMQTTLIYLVIFLDAFWYLDQRFLSSDPT